MRIMGAKRCCLCFHGAYTCEGLSLMRTVSGHPILPQVSFRARVTAVMFHLSAWLRDECRPPTTRWEVPQEQTTDWVLLTSLYPGAKTTAGRQEVSPDGTTDPTRETEKQRGKGVSDDD